MNLCFIVSPRVHRRSHIFLIASAQIGPPFHQEFHHVTAIAQDSVIDWPLLFDVRQVKIRSEVDHQLSDLNVTLPHAIIDGRLPVLVLPV